jgi:hypothetical protein
VLNVLFTKTLKKMKLDITHMLTKSTSPFYGIIPGNAAIPLGSVVLTVTIRETRENYLLTQNVHLAPYTQQAEQAGFTRAKSHETCQSIFPEN